jgi:glycosyltransferase involved in cell wall biosynthesis
MHPDIAVVIPTYNRADRLPDVVAMLEGQTLAPERFEVLIIDNGSTDDTAEVLAKLAAATTLNLRPLKIAVNDGPAAARNLGWQRSECEFLAYTDDDVVCDPTWLEAGLAAMQDDPTLGVMQGQTRPPDGTVLEDAPDWTIWRIISGPTPHFEGCNIYFRKAALAEVGGFDEAIGWWGEDTSTGWQIVDAGWGRGFCAEAAAVHPLEVRGPMYYIRNGYLEKNSIILGVRHPGYRAELFWRPWAFRKRDAVFALAAASTLTGLFWRPALVGVLPYVLRWGRPELTKPQRAKRYAQAVAVDAARLAGHAVGSWESRALIL